MGGSIHIGGDNYWVSSFGRYDHVLERLLNELQQLDAPALRQRLRDATEPNLRHLNIDDLSNTDYALFADALRRAHQRFRDDGPAHYGGHPETYDSFLREFDDLVRLAEADPRLRR